MLDSLDRIPPALVRTLRHLQLVLLDFDGVLTTGRKGYGPNGLTLLQFDARDGLGIALLQAAGLLVGAVSSGSSPIVEARASDLGLDPLLLGATDKRALIETAVLQKTGIPWVETLVMGDDLWDLDAMKAAGVAVAPGDAHTSALRTADLVTAAGGGKGSVREMADLVLESRGLDPIDLIRKL